MNIIDWFLSPEKSKNIGFEDVLHAIKHPTDYLIINTLSPSEQSCLISTTIQIDKEEQEINSLLNQYLPLKKQIIIYGKHACDPSVDQKQKQLLSLGFHAYVYRGGLFEWLLLQEIYGSLEFPTENTSTGRIDILKYKPQPTI
jgi:hypothetical protein